MDNKSMQGVEAGGFLFLNGEDAVLADKERKQIEYLEKKLDYQNTEQILMVFQKLIDERTFKTPVGTLYLKRLQNYLNNKEYIDKGRIPSIPVYEPCERITYESKVHLNTVKEAKIRKKVRQESNHKISIILNIALIIGIIVMFWMTLQSDTPNMINYKTALENKYATWEQELAERERAVREKEIELKIQEE